MSKYSKLADRLGGAALDWGAQWQIGQTCADAAAALRELEAERNIPLRVGPWCLEEIKPPSGLGAVRATAIYERRVNNGADARIAITATMGILPEAIRTALEGKGDD